MIYLNQVKKEQKKAFNGYKIAYRTKYERKCSPQRKDTSFLRKSFTIQSQDEIELCITHSIVSLSIIKFCALDLEIKRLQNLCPIQTDGQSQTHRQVFCKIITYFSESLAHKICKSKENLYSKIITNRIVSSCKDKCKVKIMNLIYKSRRKLNYGVT